MKNKNQNTTKNNKDDFSQEEILEPSQGEDGGVEDKGGLKNTIKNKLIPGAAYTVGALIVIVGAILLGFEHWESMSSISRVTSIFGVGFLSYLLVLAMEYYSQDSKFLKSSLSVLAAILMFAGGGVIASE